jgi:hypothetical protein
MSISLWHIIVGFVTVVLMLFKSFDTCRIYLDEVEVWVVFFPPEKVIRLSHIIECSASLIFVLQC